MTNPFLNFAGTDVDSAEQELPLGINKTNVSNLRENRKMRSLIFCVSFALVSAFMAGPGCQTLHADIIVEVDSKSFTVGGSGTVDVWVYSNDGDVNISGFGFDFLIDSGVTNVGSFVFIDVQVPNEAANPDYIFFGEGDPFAVPGDPAIEIQGGDLNLGADGFATLGADRRLLVQLDVKHVLPDGTDSALALGDIFTINPNFAGGFFEFLNELGDPDTIDINETLSFGGTITTSAAAIPEPGSFACLLLAGIAWAGVRSRRNPSVT